MKAVLFTLILSSLFLNSAFAIDEPNLEVSIKSCTYFLDNSELGLIHQKVDFQSTNTGHVAIITDLTIPGPDNVSYETATILTETVRENIENASDDDLIDFNFAELLVYHAISLLNDPDLESIFEINFDLTKIHKAVVYQIGEKSILGAPAVVEAYDKDDNLLGSYFGGFLALQCK